MSLIGDIIMLGVMDALDAWEFSISPKWASQTGYSVAEILGLLGTVSTVVSLVGGMLKIFVPCFT